jgi:RNA polymerase sigma-70 factor (ECF subfamily)
MDNAAMVTTSPSLLQRLRRPDEPAAWARFVELYTPLLYHWARRAGLQEADAADLVQDVFAVLLRQMPLFAYDRHKSFRGWLRTVTLNKWRERQRRRAPGPPPDGALADLPGPDGLADFEEAEYRQHLARRALQLMQAEFPPAAWKACWEVVVAGRPAAEVAAELGVRVEAVYTAKSRILRRLRQEMAGLLD